MEILDSAGKLSKAPVESAELDHSMLLVFAFRC